MLTRAGLAVVSAVVLALLVPTPASAAGAKPFHFPYRCDHLPGFGTICSESHGVFKTGGNGVTSVYINNGSGRQSFTGEGDYAGCSQVIESRDHTVSVTRRGATQVEMVNYSYRSAFTCGGTTIDCTQTNFYIIANGAYRFDRSSVECAPALRLTRSRAAG